MMLLDQCVIVKWTFVPQIHYIKKSFRLKSQHQTSHCGAAWGTKLQKKNLPNCLCLPQAEQKLQAQDQVENEVISKVCFSKLSVISGKIKCLKLHLLPVGKKQKWANIIICHLLINMQIESCLVNHFMVRVSL